MTIQSRKCANCASFNPTPDAEEPRCWNLVSGEIFANGLCEDYRTHEEDAEEWAMCDSYRRLGCEWAIPEYIASSAAARAAIFKASQKVLL